MTDTTTRARALLAAATPGPWEADAWCNYDDGGWAAIGPHHMATEDEGYDDAPESPAYDRAMADAALIAAAPELIAALCDEVASAERRAKEAEAQAAAIRKACDDRGGVHTYYVGDHGWGYYEKCPVCEDVAEAMGDAGRAILDRLAAAEAERDALRAELTLVMAECARLRSGVDVEREQSAAFVKDIERLRVVEAGAAIMRRVLNEVGRYAEWASTVREALRDGAGKDFLIQLVSAECDLARARQELEFDRKYAEQALDAASAEKERLRAEIEKERAEVKRLRARRPVLCTRCWGDPLCCRECGGSGAVFVEGGK